MRGPAGSAVRLAVARPIASDGEGLQIRSDYPSTRCDYADHAPDPAAPPLVLVLAQSGVIHASGYRRVGNDHLGNQYFQRTEETTQTNRDRVVLFGPRFQTGVGAYDASCVAPEWHAWLHHMTDDVPSTNPWPKPSYHLEKPAYDGTGAHAGRGGWVPHAPKGQLVVGGAGGGGQGFRNWSKVEAWTPPSS